MRIAIVNDLAIAVEALRRSVVSIPGASVAWIARDGCEAIESCARDLPDLILMDLVMPNVDGVEATRVIMQQTPCPILVVTATVLGHVSQVCEALGAGAVDAVATPALGTSGGLEGAAELVSKIATVSALATESARPSFERAAPAARAPHRPQRSQVPPLVAIGASTGGPQALATILGALDPGLRASIAIVQHIDRAFASGLARWLAGRTRLPVDALTRTTTLEPGRVWIAAAEEHLVLADDLTLRSTPEPRDALHRPSIDVFFESVAAHLDGHGCAALLTGMGRDGADGLVALRRAGFLTIAQDEKTSVVWGMPRVAAERGGAAEILPLPRIAARITAHVRSLGEGGRG